MKPYALILLCSVAAGQSKVESFYPPPCKAPDKAEYMNLLISGEDVLRCVHFAKPHKAKTAAKVALGQSTSATKNAPAMCHNSTEWMHQDAQGHQYSIVVSYPCGHPEKALCDPRLNQQADCPLPTPPPTVKPSDLSATMEALAPTKWSCTTDATESRVVIVCEKGSK